MTWVTIVLLSDNYCTFTSINLVWKHLKELKRPSENTKAVQTKIYTNVVTLMVAHVCFDLLALVGYAVSQFATDLAPFDRSAIGTVSSSMCAFHVAMFPIVYTGVRDLKFRDQVQQRLNAPKISGSKEDMGETHQMNTVDVTIH